MGMFTTVRIDNSIELPFFPPEIDRDDMLWQSKSGLNVYSGPYRITEAGRLERQQTSFREKTGDEKQAEAKKWGFDSWDAYVQCYEEHDYSAEDAELVPPAVEWDADTHGYDDAPPLFGNPMLATREETWWTDVSHHGTFEFHQMLDSEEHELDLFLEYEARFTKGDLDTIVFMGERMSDGDDPVSEALDKIQEWREENYEN